MDDLSGPKFEMRSMKIGSWRFQEWWVAIYAIGLTLIPPIQIHNRLVFAGEWLLLPLILAVALKGNIQKPRGPLLYLWGACLIVFLAGFFRGNLANQISIYDLTPFKYFSIKDDGIVFVRTFILFSTPWLLRNAFQEKRQEGLKIFLTTFKWAILVSSLLAILDERALGLINLKSWGYISSEYEFWSHRARGTFNTPIDASFMYGVSAVYLLTGPDLLLKRPFNLAVLIFSCVALVLTHGGTAIGSLLVVVFAYMVLGRTFKKKDIAIAIGLTILALFFSTFLLPHNFLAQKSGDFVYRIKTYRNYLNALPSSPWIFLVGIGYSRLCSDNNFILLFIQGGILYFVSVLNWVWTLLSHISKSFVFVFLFWIMTWLSFDTMTYWGIGRFCWVLFGLI